MAPVVVGVVLGAHGVRGLVRVKTFTGEPQAIAAYGPLADAQGRRFDLTVLQPGKDGVVVAKIAGVADRDAAQALKGTELTIQRQALPTLDEDEFYLADLIGLEAVTPSGEALGRIKAVQNFGAGDVLEVAGRYFAFTREVVPEVDLKAGRVVIDPPAETIVAPQREGESDPETALADEAS